ncbi:acyl carrier protein [Streptomyces sp. NPDC050732]|uniref:acyl carrier protein n=1 Tax=Streptomyces sp. NPDC050732 TaxID=3154632 RepID=UPI00341564CC
MSINRDEVTQIVLDYLAQYDTSGTPDFDENLFETGRVNSLFAIQLVGFLESTFRIKMSVDDLDLQNFSTVNCIADLVQAKSATVAGA